MVGYTRIFAIIQRAQTQGRKWSLYAQADTIYDTVNRNYVGISQLMVRTYLTIYRQLNYDVGTGVMGATIAAATNRSLVVPALSSSAAAAVAASQMMSLRPLPPMEAAMTAVSAAVVTDRDVVPANKL